MTQLTAFWTAHKAVILLIGGKLLQYALGLVLVNVPNAPAWVKTLKTALDDVLPNPSMPQCRAMLKKLPLPLTSAVTLLFALTCASTAQAQTVSSGPSLAFMEIRPGWTAPVQESAGFGYQLSVGFFPIEVLGTQADLLDFGGALYGSVISGQTGPTNAALGASLFIGTMNELIGVGIGEDILNSGSTPFGFPPYAVILLNLQRIAFGPYSPPVGVSAGAAGLPRFLTTYLHI